MSFRTAAPSIWGMAADHPVRRAARLRLGLARGSVFGTLDYLIGSKFAIDWTTIICDYFLAFTRSASARVCSPARWSVFYGTVIGGLLRFLAHYLVGALVWGKYMPDEFFGMSMTSPWFYSLLYNGSYMLPDIILCAVVFALLYRPLKKYFTGADLIAA